MRHLIMREPQCLLYSAAMVLDCEVADITDILGHDGLERISDAPGHDGLRGVHIQEIQTIAYLKGRLFSCVEAIPVRALAEPLPLYHLCGMDYACRFMFMIKNNRGILMGTINNSAHAVAFEDETIYDPCGDKYAIGQRLQIREAWILR